MRKKNPCKITVLKATDLDVERKCDDGGDKEADEGEDGDASAAKTSRRQPQNLPLRQFRF